jgi:hypothetical protein
MRDLNGLEYQAPTADRPLLAFVPCLIGADGAVGLPGDEENWFAAIQSGLRGRP